MENIGQTITVPHLLEPDQIISRLGDKTDISKVEEMICQYPDYTKTVDLPDGSSHNTNSWEHVLNSYLNKNSSEMKFYIVPEVKHETKIINVIILPIIESA